MFSVVRANVVGVVIAPRGTEHLPRDRRPFVWRTMIRPLVEEVAEYEEFPAAAVREVSRELFRYCLREGLAMPLGDEGRPKD